jgi:hypothetical protein
MSVIDRLPTLDGGALVAIERNAHRWVSRGTDEQKAEAERVLLAIAAERRRRLDQVTSGSPDDVGRSDTGAAASVTDRGFPAIWMKIVQPLHPGDVIRNWGYATGHTGGTFRIEDVGNSAVTVYCGTMVQPRAIPKGDFEKVYAVWSDSCAGNYPRAKMTNLSQNTTYILGILRRVTSG